MKTWNLLAAIALSMVTVATLSACGKKKNGSTASTPASTCTMNAYGAWVDTYGRSCNPSATANTCTNVRYDATTGRYISLTTGQVVNCGVGNGGYGYYDGYNSIPYQGQYGNTTISGCAGWSQIYGAQYIPVDIGDGQLVCMNTAYLNQRYGSQVNWNQYYYSHQPIYSCGGYDCNGGYYGGNYYSCNTNVAIGFNFGYGGVGANLCF
ncbi:MAG: hypothetical protein HC902_02335 [Calothrix sp. SM1_5_4]|nr:hypothetical protein [Calothrix sp. SM1_5_4]